VVVSASAAVRAAQRLHDTAQFVERLLGRRQAAPAPLEPPERPVQVGPDAEPLGHVATSANPACGVMRARVARMVERLSPSAMSDTLMARFPWCAAASPIG